MRTDVDRVMVNESLKNLEKGTDAFSGRLRAYQELLDIQAEARSRAVIDRPGFSKSFVTDRLRQGIPLLPFEAFQPDWVQVQTVYGQIVHWAAKDPEASGEIDDLRWAGSTPALLRDAAEAWYRSASLKGLNTPLEVETVLLASVVGAALKPFLSAYSEVLMPEVDQESWRRNYCPICGGKPDFSSLKEGGTRWLFCSRCDGEWLFSRIGCPFCGTENQEALAYFTGEESSSLYRVYVCEACRSYLKAIDSRVSHAEVMLPLERILTLDLDRQGQENGYEPGWMTWTCYDGSSPGPVQAENERRGC